MADVQMGTMVQAITILGGIVALLLAALQFANIASERNRSERINQHGLLGMYF